jgi:hypothetical protein
MASIFTLDAPGFKVEKLYINRNALYTAKQLK